MKKLLILITGFGLLFFQQSIYSRDFTEHLKKEFTLRGNATNTTLCVYNISGFIHIEGVAGNSIVIEMDKTISADDPADLETGKKEFRLDFEQTDDSITAYIAEPFDSRPRRNRNQNNSYNPDYEFNVDFTIKVPSGINLRISTVNEGNIEISNVAGNLHVNNVNESISITNAHGSTYAHTINGDVIVTYVTNPPEQSSYYTINGDIRISYRPDLSADVTFKSMNGNLYTDFPDAESLPVAAVKTQEKRGGNTVYKLNKATTVRFGKGGKTYSFETLNGNVYIKKQS
ncbi:MAG TPA: hypothetical protein VHO46_10285 [Bacteroidales bacterium]|nr:hypothetical protein [Bacteroidales bacterium]